MRISGVLILGFFLLGNAVAETEPTSDQHLNTEIPSKDLEKQLLAEDAELLKKDLSAEPKTEIRRTRLKDSKVIDRANVHDRYRHRFPRKRRAL